jgi:DUF4097 and DUF4098 domain-containing protein YvlB
MELMKVSTSVALVAVSVISASCTVTVDSHSEVAREQKNFTVNGVADLRLTTFDGSIDIRSWDKPEILIEIEKRGPTKASLDELQIVSDQKDNRIELEVKRPGDGSFRMGFHRSATASLTVSVPRDVNVVARSGDGSIKAERINGRIDLRTGDGSITTRDVSGELMFVTSDGSVRVDNAQGRLNVDTGDGSVDVGGKFSVVKLHTGDGSVVYRAEEGSEMTDDWEITTGDGSVSVYVPRRFSAEVDAHTGDGSIRSDLDELPRPARSASGRTLTGKLGDGGKRLRIRTGDGAIRLGST